MEESVLCVFEADVVMTCDNGDLEFWADDAET